jgi:DNA-binding transcriptional MocR family regulator
MSLDRRGRTIYMGSFSKVLWPTLRLGFIVATERLMGAFHRQLTLRGPIASVERTTGPRRVYERR